MKYAGKHRVSCSLNKYSGKHKILQIFTQIFYSSINPAQTILNFHSNRNTEI